jgi:hypothetical protein
MHGVGDQRLAGTNYAEHKLDETEYEIGDESPDGHSANFQRKVQARFCLGGCLNWPFSGVGHFNSNPLVSRRASARFFQKPNRNNRTGAA